MRIPEVKAILSLGSPRAVGYVVSLDARVRIKTKKEYLILINGIIHVKEVLVSVECEMS